MKRQRATHSVGKNARRANSRRRATFAEEGMNVVFRRRWNEDDYYDDDDGRWQRIARIAAVAVLAVVLAVAGVLMIRRGGDSTNAGGIATAAPTTSPVANSTPGPFDPIDPSNLDATSRTTTDSVTDDPTAESAATVGGTYALTPDGQPEPVTVIITPGAIRMSGSVPSETARAQLTILLTSISDGAVAITDDVTVNPSVPVGVAVRIVPLDAPAYTSGTYAIEAAHAASIDRIVRLLNAVEQASLLVVTHTDQAETPSDVLLLSIARVSAELAYLANAGIAADRLSSRAVGSTDPITTGTTPDALAANRRTDYVVSGLFVTP